MTQPYATVDGHRAASVVVHVPGVGPWFADVTMEGAPALSGRVTISLGALELVGTVDARHAGTRSEQQMLRVVAGGGGWGTLLPARAYHNDSRIRALQVAQDAAREAGETLGDFSPGEERVGIDYVRQAGPASRVLEDVIGGGTWWVDYDGTTHVGTRDAAAVEPGAYELVDFAPAERIAVLAVTDLRALAIGSVLSDGLDESQTVRELEISVGADAVRVRAWCGGSDGARGRLLDAIRAIVERIVDGRIYGPRKYRVSRMSGDRVELQAVRRGGGLPDILPISMWPGAAGVHAELAGGAEVLVQFVDGDRTQPVVTHFAGKDGTGWTPANVVLSASGASASIKLGAGASKTLAYAEDVAQAFSNVQATIDAFLPGTGGAEFPTPFVAPSASAIGTSKAVAE